VCRDQTPENGKSAGVTGAESSPERGKNEQVQTRESLGGEVPATVVWGKKKKRLGGSPRTDVGGRNNHSGQAQEYTGGRRGIGQHTWGGGGGQKNSGGDSNRGCPRGLEKRVVCKGNHVPGRWNRSKHAVSGKGIISPG